MKKLDYTFKQTDSEASWMLAADEMDLAASDVVRHGAGYIKVTYEAGRLVMKRIPPPDITSPNGTPSNAVLKRNRANHGDGCDLCGAIEADMTGGLCVSCDVRGFCR